MLLQPENLSPVSAHGFKQAVAVEQAVVKDGDACLIAWCQRAIDVDVLFQRRLSNVKVVFNDAGEACLFTKINIEHSTSNIQRRTKKNLFHWMLDVERSMLDVNILSSAF